MTTQGRRNGRKTNRKVERSTVSELSNTVALAVWYLMRKDGITSGNALSEALGAPAGLTQAPMNRKLNGRGEFDLGDIAILAQFFDVSPVELVAGLRLSGSVTLAPLSDSPISFRPHLRQSGLRKRDSRRTPSRGPLSDQRSPKSCEIINLRADLAAVGSMRP